MKIQPAIVDGHTRYVLEGLHYLQFLPRFVHLKKAASYFEIGVNKGKSLSRIHCASVGVDPEFVVEADIIGKKPSLHLFQVKSDEFFASHRLTMFFPKGVDVAFLDGMHQFEFLLRDFINTEKYTHSDSVIFMHDCLPINAEMAERERRPHLRKDKELKSYWTGDVWKVLPILREFRPDLQVTALNCAPTGLIMVSGSDRASSVLHDRYDEIVRRFMAIELDEESLARFYADGSIDDAQSCLDQFKH